MGSLENGTQLTRFIVQGVQFGATSDVAFDEDQQPVLGFIGFLDCDAQLGNELGPGPGAATGGIIGGNAAARFGELPHYLHSYKIAWQCSEESAEADSKSPGTIAQFLRPLVHALARSTRHTIEKSPEITDVVAVIGRKCNEKGLRIGQFQQLKNPQIPNPKIPNP